MATMRLLLRMLLLGSVYKNKGGGLKRWPLQLQNFENDKFKGGK